ncbi:MAG TPA: rhodanese-like domain-containing protein [Polyangia bacterium]
MKTKILVVGGVAGGATAAARACRIDETALILQTPEGFDARYGIRVLLETEINRLPKHRRIVVHCRSGFRAHLAVRQLKQRGFADVANLTGGHLSLIAEGGFAWETSA